MLTAEDIKSIVSIGEGYYAEFKQRLPSKIREVTLEVCAFANAAGGVILIGVDDKNTVTGTTMDNARISALQHSIGDINPHIHCPIYKVEVDGKEIWVIEVASGPQNLIPIQVRYISGKDLTRKR